MWRGPRWRSSPASRGRRRRPRGCDELRLVARERLVDARIRAGRHAEAVVEGRGAGARVPAARGGLAAARAGPVRGGRQGDALATLRRARAAAGGRARHRPGARGCSNSSGTCWPRAVELPRGRPRGRPRRAPPAAGRRHRARPPGPVAARVRRAGGRAGRAAPGRRCGRRGEPSIVLVAGEAGGGKSALLGVAARELGAAGLAGRVGRCPEVGRRAAGLGLGGGAARRWPPRSTSARSPSRSRRCSPTRSRRPRPSDAARRRRADGRFQLHRAVGRLAGPARRPALAVFLEDVHRADDETRRCSPAARQGLGAPACCSSLAYRPETRARAGRAAGRRWRRAPRRACGWPGWPTPRSRSWSRPSPGRPPEAVVVRPSPSAPTAIRSTSGERAPARQRGRRWSRPRRCPRAWPTSCAAASPGCRRSRVGAAAGRGHRARRGRRAARARGRGRTRTRCSTRWRPALISGLLRRARRPGSSASRTCWCARRSTPACRPCAGVRWHARVAEAVAALYPDDLTALAHHSVAAATPATAADAARRARRGGRAARARVTPTTRRPSSTAQAARCLDLRPRREPPRQRVEVRVALVRALVSAGGDRAPPLDVRHEAVEIAAATGDDDLLAARDRVVERADAVAGARCYLSVDDHAGRPDRAAARPTRPASRRCAAGCCARWCARSAGPTRSAPTAW